MTREGTPPTPADFPIAAYESVQRRMGPQQPLHPDEYRHYAGGWNAVHYRTIGCEKCVGRYTDLFASSGVAPQQDERIAQDNALFGFFVYALSAIESCFFAMHAVASILAPADFPMATEQDLKQITPKVTIRRFDRRFGGSVVSTAMRQTVSETEYQEWKNLRNVLVHRSVPGRHFFQPPRSTPRDADWVEMGIVLDLNTLDGRYPWLTSVLERLIEATDQFTAQHF